MSTITRERLIKIQQWRETYGPGSNVVLPAGEAEELARIALASLEAEPVASCMVEYGGMCIDGFGEYVGHSLPDGSHPLYAAPPAPVSVPDRSMFEKWWESEHGSPFDSWDSLRTTDGYCDEGIDVQFEAWNACRAAMLQGADKAPVKQPSSNSIVGWLRADYRDDNRSLRGNAPLFVLGKKDPSTVWGLDYIPLTSNSPVIPDGWVACSERMPHIGVPVITCCGDVVQYAAYAWDGKEWQDWYEEYDKLPANTFTHWHPRPAAPQQEVK